MAILLSILSGAGAAGATWGALSGQVARNGAAIVELRADFTAHAALRGHPVSVEHFATVDRRLEALEKMAQDERAMREDVSRVRADVAALCRANKAANCSP